MCLGLLLYAFIDMCVQSGFAFKSMLLLLLVFVLAVFGVFLLYFPGVRIDRKNDKVKLMLGFSANDIHERELAHIASLDVEKEANLGIYFIVNDQSGHSERFFYRFYRVSFIEAMQFKRIKRELASLKL